MPSAKGSDALHVGDKVYALWQGSTKWFPAKVVGNSSTKISVEFHDGTVESLSAKYITVSSW